MYDKLERHNSHKVSYVFNRRLAHIKSVILSFFRVKTANNLQIGSSKLLNSR